MITCFLALALFGQISLMPDAAQPKISVQNAILVQINDTSLSVMDVKKKMDIAFNQQYPDLASSSEARYQFYETSWRRVLEEMINQELVLVDAAHREIQLTDGEVREEMEARFGPNLMQTLDRIALTYDDARNIVKKDLLFQRMTGYFVYMKAMQKVTPQDIRQAYRLYVKDHPPFREWKYRVLSTPSPEIAEQVHAFLKLQNQFPEEGELRALFPTLQISGEYTSADNSLSETYQAALSTLTPGTYSDPISFSGRTRIFYLYSATDHPAPPFEALAGKLKEALFQEALVTESDHYFAQLRNRYSFHVTTEDLRPFHLER